MNAARAMLETVALEYDPVRRRTDIGNRARVLVRSGRSK